jgi:hypothetical protein
VVATYRQPRHFDHSAGEGKGDEAIVWTIAGSATGRLLVAILLMEQALREEGAAERQGK